MINPEFFTILKNSDFNGPVTIHFEYHVEGKGKQRINNLMNAMKKDAAVLRNWLS
jgi:hypothetical protein